MVKHLTVVGSGLIGMLTAYELAHAGVDVTLFDHNNFNQDLQWSTCGICSTLYPWTEPAWVQLLAKESRKYYPALCQHIKQQTGIDSDFASTGLLLIKPDNPTQVLKQAKAHHMHCLQMNNEQYSLVQTHIGKGISDAVWFPTVNQIRPTRLVKGLKTCLQKHPRITLFENQPVSEILVESSKVKGILCNGKKYYTENVLMNVDVELLPLLDRLVPNHPFTFESANVIAILSRPEFLKTLIHSKDYLFMPREDGLISIMKQKPIHGQFLDTVEEKKMAMAEYAYSIMPALRKYSIVKQLFGQRLAGKRPLLTKVASVEGLSLAGGFGMHDVATAPASAKLMSEIILERPYSLEVDQFKLIDDEVSAA